MKYLIIQTPVTKTPQIIDSYLIRNCEAIVKRFKTLQKVYVLESKAKDYFGSLVNFKSFCVHTLPYIKTEKLKHRIYRASVELVQI